MKRVEKMSNDIVYNTSVPLKMNFVKAVFKLY